MKDQEKIICPRCGETKSIKLLTTYKTAGIVVGGGVGFAIGLIAAREGAKTGAVVGAKVGRFIPVVGAVGGAALGGCGGAIAGMLTCSAIGSTAGEAVDRLIIKEYECEKCGAVFKVEQELEIL